MALRADEDDLAGLLCYSHKRSVEAVIISAIGTNVKLLIYRNRPWYFIVQFLTLIVESEKFKFDLFMSSFTSIVPYRRQSVPFPL